MSQRPLDRLASELWSSRDLSSRPGEGFRAHKVVQANGVTMVLPVDSRSSAEAMRRWTDATSSREALTRSAAAAAMRLGGIRLLRGRPVYIRVRSGAGANPTLHEYLASAVGAPSVALSCNLGAPRPNQKPIIRIHAADGETLGFAKVAWNDLTTELVETEARFLTLPAVTRESRIRVPGVTHTGCWQDKRIVVTSPLIGRRRSGPAAAPDVALIEVIVGLGRAGTHRLRESPYVASIGDRIETLSVSAASSARAALAALLDGAGETVLRFGQWHGDWTPWNMNSAGSTPIVWDWERTASGVPVGFDLLHWHFHTGMNATTSPTESLIVGAQKAGPALRVLGVEDAHAALLTKLYALEMHLRFADGATSPDSVRWISGLLESVMSEAGT